MKMRKITAVILCIAMMTTAFVFTGCEKVENKGENGSAASSSEQSGKTDDGKSDYVKDVKLSFASETYINDGDESVPKLIDGVDAEIKLNEKDTVKEIEAVIDLLRSVPEDVKGAVTFVTDDIQIGNITVDGTKCSIDLKGDLSELDPYTEQFFVYQIVDSLLESFDEIDSVSFTANGDIVDTLAGHMDMSQPFTEKSVDEFEGDSE